MDAVVEEYEGELKFANSIYGMYSLTNRGTMNKDEQSWLTKHEKIVILVVLLGVSVIAIVLTVIFSNRSVARAVSDYQQYVVSQFQHKTAAAAVATALLQQPVITKPPPPDETASATYKECISV